MGQIILTLQINELEGGVETSATEAERALFAELMPKGRGEQRGEQHSAPVRFDCGDPRP